MTRTRLSPTPWRSAGVPRTVGNDEAAGHSITGELPPDLALPVWQTLRCVLQWAAEEPALRGDLFEASGMIQWEERLLRETWDVDVRAALVVIIGELAHPGAAAPDAVAHACLCVSNWALRDGYSATALGYVEAAGLCMPEHPRYAWIAGRVLRSHGRATDAAIWLKRAERTAAARNDREVQILALNSLGNLHYQLTGDFKAAARAHREALRLARKHHQLAKVGELLHDLFVVSWYSGETDAAEEYARQALAVYRSEHARLPALAHDLAFCWMVHGYYARAAAVLHEAIPHLTDSTDQIRAMAVFAAAVAGCGESERFSSIADDVRSRVDARNAGTDCGIALIELARGATSLREWTVARSALERAIEIGGGAAEPNLRREAEALLIAVEGRVPCAPAGKNDPEHGHPLAVDLVLALHERTTSAGAQTAAPESRLN